MGKKILIVISVAFIVFLFGDLLFIVSKNPIIANWGSIIIPSFIIGCLWKLLFKNDSQDISCFSLAGSIGIIKLFSAFIQISNLTILAMILMLIIYPLVSYMFIKLGIKITS